MADQFAIRIGGAALGQEVFGQMGQAAEAVRVIGPPGGEKHADAGEGEVFVSQDADLQAVGQGVGGDGGGY